jgi:hypothetical protein
MGNNQGRRTRAPRAQRLVRTIANELTSNASSHAPSGRSDDRDVAEAPARRAPPEPRQQSSAGTVSAEKPRVRGPHPISQEELTVSGWRVTTSRRRTPVGRKHDRGRAALGGCRRLESGRAADGISGHGSRRPGVRPGCACRRKQGGVIAGAEPGLRIGNLAVRGPVPLPSSRSAGA